MALFRFKKVRPATIRQIPIIFVIVNASLKIRNDATKIKIYTKAEVSGMI
jgi:hypothetical protein